MGRGFRNIDDNKLVEFYHRDPGIFEANKAAGEPCVPKVRFRLYDMLLPSLFPRLQD
jgi:hypothetical protein